jgi:signal peptidase I
MKAITMMVIVSDSMKPEFQRGDIILSQSFDLGVSEGDIITFNAINSQYAITHRVIEIKGDRIITRGDANPWNDEYYTTQKDVIFKSINLSSNPIVIKGIGNLFITDYSKQGMIYKFGDQYDFMQKLSSTIKIWGWVITMIALSLYIVLMKR